MRKKAPSERPLTATEKSEVLAKMIEAGQHSYMQLRTTIENHRDIANDPELPDDLRRHAHHVVEELLPKFAEIAPAGDAAYEIAAQNVIAIEVAHCQNEEMAGPENVRRLQAEAVANASPAERKRFKLLAKLAAQPRESAWSDFVSAFGPATSTNQRNALSRFLWEFACQYTSGQVKNVASFMREQRRKGPRAGGNASGVARNDKANREWHNPCIVSARKKLASGTSPHEVTGKLQEQFDKSKRQIRTVLQDAGVLKNKRK